MSDIHYINTQAIRKDLVGFLKELEAGEEVAVLNRSKVIARLNRPRTAVKATSGVKQLLDAADEIHRTTKKKPGGLGATESYKKRYYRDMAKKHGIS
jgi:antitoxin (DNA-binding transcriptional repressor) of toxin-antitoxin stability system